MTNQHGEPDPVPGTLAHIADTTPVVRATEYTVNLLPDDDLDGHVFALTVRYRGGGRWAVQRGEHSCLGADGTWAQGIRPYDRGDDWLDAHRFDLDTALRLAKEAAPKVTVNGLTAAEAALRWRERDGTLDEAPTGGSSTR